MQSAQSSLPLLYIYIRRSVLLGTDVETTEKGAFSSKGLIRAWVAVWLQSGNRHAFGVAFLAPPLGRATLEA